MFVYLFSVQLFWLEFCNCCCCCCYFCSFLLAVFFFFSSSNKIKNHNWLNGQSTLMHTHEKRLRKFPWSGIDQLGRRSRILSSHLWYINKAKNGNCWIYCVEWWIRKILEFMIQWGGGGWCMYACACSFDKLKLFCLSYPNAAEGSESIFFTLES